jgi:hypothetical protein
VAFHPEALFLFDPTAFNNQCHLYALMVAQTIDQAKIENVDAKRFLCLSFCLSYAFLTDPKLIDQVACKALVAMKAAPPSKEFRLFLKDPESTRMHAARQALNLLFEEHMKRTLSSGEGSLDPELALLAHQDLQFASDGGRGALYTFPKFAGVAYLVEAIFRENVALLFKVKVVTKEGNGSFSHSGQNIEALNPMMPVVIFEMVATDHSLSVAECLDNAKRCPNHSQRNVSRKNRHQATESCLFCTSSQVDVTSYQQRFQPLLMRTQEMFLALGADFILQEQRPFLSFFTDRKRFPQLTALFEKSIPTIEEFALSMTKPLNMSVSHAYVDSAAQASKSGLVIDASYETHLKTRGLI